MWSALKVRRSQGRQYIVDVRRAVPQGFRGLPVLAAEPPCDGACRACADVCPTAAIELEPLRLDLGRCVFCAACADVCPAGKITFSPDTHMASSSRQQLVVREGDQERSAVEVSRALQRVFGRSLKLRSVSAGGCNGCELELNAASNVNFDFGRFGIDWVASPRHADALVLSGPLTRHMAEAVELAYRGMPEPKFVISFGACAISGGLYAESTEIDRTFLERFVPSLYVPGCPPHPLTLVNGLLDLLGIQVASNSRASNSG
jgi:Ni,Fe-hydrogenase III small subunit/ferredoxin